MTTAHRPTWKPAYGLSDPVNKGYVPTRSFSARDQPSYLKLKDRRIGQGSFDQLKQRDFKADLIKRQEIAKRIRNGQVDVMKNAQIEITEDRAIGYDKNASIYNDQVDFVGAYQSGPSKKIKRPGEEEVVDLADNPFPQDADSQEFVREEESQEKKARVQSEDEDDDDDDEQLLRQYEKIKQQREKEELHKRQEKHRQSVAQREAQLLKGNPLIDSSFSLSKRWYEDTVFRNQSRKLQEKKSFINDYVRSDFHRKFMHRYVCR